MTRKNSMPKPNIAPIALEIMKRTEPSKKRTTEMIASMLARFQIDKMQSEQRLLGERRLASQGYKAYSEGDQDGIIQEIFRRIGVTNKFFVEFGCGDGLQNNTSWKFYYSTDTGTTSVSGLAPGVNAGTSSGHCGWRT